MTIKIDKKIIGYAIKNQDTPPPQPTPAPAPVSPAPIVPQVLDQFDERLERPEVLIGSTYKIVTPLSDYALYVTINDVVLNQGTPDEVRRPFEIFINSKNMDHFSWIVALTRVMSAVFRNGGNVSFLVEELRSVFDPKGGYLKPGGKYMPSLVAEIGDIIEMHLQTIGMIPSKAGKETTDLESILKHMQKMQRQIKKEAKQYQKVT